jgi:hypothetical protein
VALDRDLAVDRDSIAVAVDRLGREGQFGVGLGVEEVRALQVRGEVVVLDLNGRDLCVPFSTPSVTAAPKSPNVPWKVPAM